MNSSTPLLDNWQTILSQTIDSPEALIRHLQLPEELIEPAREASKGFPLRIPAPYLQRIRKGDINDPLLRQVLPLGDELRQVPGFVTDPLAEMAANHRDGLIHKYKGRVLLVITGACAINCRYCFRRHFPYEDNRLGPEQWQQVLNYIQNDDSIKEVIFSGGDPLVSSDKRLQKLIADLEQIPHLQRLRIHSRLPVVIPQRVTDTLTTTLRDTRLQSVVVLHINHPNEIDDSVTAAVQQLKKAGITVLNQAVLLKQVNDSVEVLKQLSETLFASGILPYYLFTFDPVAGAAHFDFADSDAQQLMQQLHMELPGYLVPKLAREVPGRGSKTVLPIQFD
ncbi:EF-P beta-lysylation protein EpmB [Amphritea sp. HPY]|uniref:EF-P beta-lysylation protein EpmB n=1 Tax=Amphritea sp. HPY TaxID=3421652 RepID=UPI003D7DCA77